MSNAIFWGCLLLAAGPPAVIYCLVIARKSFLVLLSLARYAKHCVHRNALRCYADIFWMCSTFFWLVVFLVIALLCRGKLNLCKQREKHCTPERGLLCRLYTIKLACFLYWRVAAFSDFSRSSSLWALAVTQVC